MNIVDENKKQVLNMISTLFCVVIINLSRFFNNDIIVCDIILFFAFLTHFVISKNFLKQFSEACIVVRKPFFLYCVIILTFRSQIFTYAYHLSKMRHSRLKRRVFLIILIHSWNYLNLIRSWNLIKDVNYFVAFSRICKSIVV